MTLLTSCWFIIESIIIPHGYVKWFYLSFYIHPLLLFLCQIFLWVKLILSLPLRFTCLVASSIFSFLSSLVSSFATITQTNISEFVDEVEENNEIPRVTNHYRITAYEERTDYENGSSLLVLLEVSLEDTAKVIYIDHEDGSLEEYCLSSDSSSNPSPSQTRSDHHLDMAICSSSIITEDVEMDGYLPSVCGSNSLLLMGRESIEYQSSWEEDLDSFYQEYTKRMRWFDLLNHDRTSGISAMLDKHVASPCSFESIKPEELSIPYISWSKIARRTLLRSLGSDFELVYVAQSCLSWEALYYQYRKVEALACSNNSQNNALYEQDVAGRFQKFQILLERFMEDEGCEGKRYWNYVQRRYSSKCLLQVPQVSGYVEGEGMRAIEVLKEIEKCIEAFWLYVKTDNEKKPMWRRVKSFLWTNYYPPVEDPRDLELLIDLTNTLQKKELWLRELQGKEKCWLKRVIKPLEESQKKEILFATIDIKLVSRVLNMSMVSTSQLKWCQEKLTNIEFKEGNIRRACSSPLFIS